MIARRAASKACRAVASVPSRNPIMRIEPVSGRPSRSRLTKTVTTVSFAAVESEPTFQQSRTAMRRLSRSAPVSGGPGSPEGAVASARASATASSVAGAAGSGRSGSAGAAAVSRVSGSGSGAGRAGRGRGRGEVARASVSVGSSASVASSGAASSGAVSGVSSATSSGGASGAAAISGAASGAISAVSGGAGAGVGATRGARWGGASKSGPSGAGSGEATTGGVSSTSASGVGSGMVTSGAASGVSASGAALSLISGKGVSGAGVSGAASSGAGGGGALGSSTASGAGVRSASAANSASEMISTSEMVTGSSGGREKTPPKTRAMMRSAWAAPEMYQPQTTARLPVLPGKVGSAGVGYKPDVGETSSVQRAHDLGDPGIGDIAVGAKEHPVRAAFGGDGTQARDQRLGGDDGFHDRNVALPGEGDGQRLLVVRRKRLGAGLGKLDRHADRQEGSRDHEDDEQDQHHVDEGRDVDLRHRLRAPPAAPAAAALGLLENRAHLALHLPRQDRRELVCEGLVARDDALAVRRKLVVEDHRRDRREKAEAGGQKRLGDAGRDDGEVRRLLLGDLDERVHDAPDGAEKPDEGRGRADGGQKRKAAVELFALFRDRHVHRPVDSCLGTGDHPPVVALRTAPLDHARREDLLGGVIWVLAQPVEELVEGLAGPEFGVEAGGLGAGLAVLDELADDDRPAPDRGYDEHDHHELHREGGPEVEAPERIVDVGCDAKNFRVHVPALPDAGRVCVCGSDYGEITRCQGELPTRCREAGRSVSEP